MNKPAGLQQKSTAVQSTAKRLFLSTFAGLMGSAMGGGLFGAFVCVVEQFDGKYDDPSFAAIVFGIPLFAVIGAVIAAPVGLIGGLVYGLMPKTVLRQRTARYVGTVSGALVGGVIGGSLQGVSITGDWEQIVGGWLLLTMGALCGAIAGRVGGTLMDRWQR